MIFSEHPEKDDIGPVFNLITKCDIADFGEADADFDDLKDDWAQLELTQDAWVIREGNEIKGYCAIMQEDDRFRMDLYSVRIEQTRIIVDKLLGDAIERVQTITVREERPVILTTFLPVSGHLMSDGLLASGFKEFTRHFRMRIDFADLLPPVEWPESFLVECFDKTSEEELFSLICNSFTWEGFIQPSIEEWRRHVFRGGRFDPEYFLLLRKSGKLVGACLGYNEEPVGWIRQLAVASELRGQGIGSLLLKHAFNAFQIGGQKSVELGVASTNQNAWQFYERCGMRRVREFIEYHRESSPRQ